MCVCVCVCLYVSNGGGGGVEDEQVCELVFSCTWA